MKDYLHGYLSELSRLEGLQVGNVTKDIRILVLGDSVDQFMTTDACKSTGAGKLSREEAQGQNLPDGYLPLTCRYPHFVVTSYRIPGSSKDGPWHGNLFREGPFPAIQKVLH